MQKQKSSESCTSELWHHVQILHKNSFAFPWAVGEEVKRVAYLHMAWEQNNVTLENMLQNNIISGTRNNVVRPSYILEVGRGCMHGYDKVETRPCHGRKGPSCAAVRALMSPALCFKEEQHANVLCKKCADKEQGLFTVALCNVAKVTPHFLMLLFWRWCLHLNGLILSSLNLLVEGVFINLKHFVCLFYFRQQIRQPAFYLAKLTVKIEQPHFSDNFCSCHI